MARPTSDPTWATDATFTAGAESGLTTRADPSGIRPQGIYANTRIPARWFNYLFGALGDWITFFTLSFFYDRNVRREATLAYDGTTDDTAALQAILNAAPSGSRILFPPGSIKITADIVLPVGLTLFAEPGTFTLKMDHATEKTITFAAAALGRAEIHGFNFEALQNNTGSVIEIDDVNFVTLVLRDCRFNQADTKLKGKILYTSGNVDVSWVDCDTVTAVTAANAFECPGKLRIQGRSLVAAPGATQDIISAADLYMRDVRCSQIKTGSADIAFISPGYIRTRVFECVFDINVDAAGANSYPLRIVEDALVLFYDNEWTQILSPYLVTSTPLAIGSRLQDRPDTYYVTAGTSVTLSNVGGTHHIYSTNAAPPDTLIHTPLFHGQKLNVIFYNGHASTDWTDAPDITGATHVAADVDEIAHNTLVGISFLAYGVAGGDPSWFQQGATRHVPLS